MNRMDVIHMLTAARFLCAATTSRMVQGAERDDFVDPVWSMYETSYRAIGLHIASQRELYKYDIWEIVFDSDRPIGFNTYTTTVFGMKTGLLGSDGSDIGRRAIKELVRNHYKRPNVYGEVSHAVERLTEGVPVVCAVHVPTVLGKPVVPLVDGVHYMRDLGGNVGMVTKKMVGSPRGVPSGSPASCPVPETTKQAEIETDAAFDHAEHAACQFDFGDEKDARPLR